MNVSDCDGLDFPAVWRESDQPKRTTSHEHKSNNLLLAPWQSKYHAAHKALNMITMTSRMAQIQFAALIDASQRQPIAVTRRGRPVAVVLSYEDYQASTQTIPFHVAKLIGEIHPLRGKPAGDAMRMQLSKMSQKATEEGLSEDDVCACSMKTEPACKPTKTSTFSRPLNFSSV
jgi:prevent-host-death family protein